MGQGVLFQIHCPQCQVSQSLPKQKWRYSTPALKAANLCADSKSRKGGLPIVVGVVNKRIAAETQLHTIEQTVAKQRIAEGELTVAIPNAIILYALLELNNPSPNSRWPC